MVRTEHGSDPQADPSLREPWLTPRRIGLGALATVAILVSPILVVYEFVLGLALVVAGYIARAIQRGPTETTVRASPFSHVPQAPASAVTAGPLLALTLIAAALVGVGLAALRRRDIG